MKYESVLCCVLVFGRKKTLNHLLINRIEERKYEYVADGLRPERLPNERIGIEVKELQPATVQIYLPHVSKAADVVQSFGHDYD